MVFLPCVGDLQYFLENQHAFLIRTTLRLKIY